MCVSHVFWPIDKKKGAGGGDAQERSSEIE